MITFQKFLETMKPGKLLSSEERAELAKKPAGKLLSSEERAALMRAKANEAKGKSSNSEEQAQQQAAKTRSDGFPCETFKCKNCGDFFARIWPRNDIPNWCNSCGSENVEWLSASVEPLKVNKMNEGVGKPSYLKLFKDKDYNEWQVVWYEDGKRNEDKTYFSGGGDAASKQDCINTMKLMQKEVDAENKKKGF